MATKWEDIYLIFWNKIENDKSFFNYSNVSQEEALALAKNRSKSLIMESIVRLTSSCTPQVNFYEYDETLEQFNFDCVQKEKDLLASLMLEKLFERDELKLKAFVVKFAPTDLKQFSPAEERKTFLEMYNGIVKSNSLAISNYSNRDRITGKLKTIDYSKYNDE